MNSFQARLDSPAPSRVPISEILLYDKTAKLSSKRFLLTISGDKPVSD